MRRLVLAPLLLALAACGDTLVDHTNTAIRDVPGGTLCADDQLVCDPACQSITVEACEACGTPCGPAPDRATATCDVVAKHQGACGYRCEPGYLDTGVPGSECLAPTALAAGAAFSCGLVEGQVHCWGDNTNGQLGDGTTAARSTAARVLGVSVATRLGAGSEHACAASGATVRCWGKRAGWGGTGADARAPVIVDALSGGAQPIAQIVAGNAHTCVLLANNTVRCAGEPNASGNGAPALGTGALALELAAGDAFTCALVSISNARSVKCWGANDRGQLGGGSGGGAQATPVPVPQLTGTLRHVAAGQRHACVVTDADPGPTTCWGDNTGKQIGSMFSGTIVGPSSNTKVNKPASTTAAAPLAAGGAVTCVVVVDASHSMNCWGSDQLAAGGNPPTGAGEENHIVGADPPGAVAIGAGHACFVAVDGKLRCWGHGTSGELGHGAFADSQGSVLVTAD